MECTACLGDAASEQKKRLEKEERVASYYVGLFFILVVMAIALYPVVSS